MDVLSNVLKVTNLTAVPLGSREFLAPWGLRIDELDKPMILLVRRGSMWLRSRGAEPVRLKAGDLVLLSSGTGQVLSSGRDTAELEHYTQAIARSHNRVVPSLHGKPDPNAESTVLLGVTYEFSQEGFGDNDRACLLPEIIRLSATQVSEDSELQALLQLLTQEAARRDIGFELVQPRLLDALLIYMLRTWLRDQPEGSAGWLGALRDPQIRRALTLIHASPEAPWTVESLAQQAAMSRAAFAKRFADLVGEPPLAYVTRWRMDLAAKFLRESREPVARIAGKVGYLSETAFAKAFRRRRKMPPGAYRYQRSGRVGSGAAKARPSL